IDIVDAQLLELAPSVFRNSISGARRKCIDSAITKSAGVRPNALEEKQSLPLQLAALNAGDKSYIRPRVFCRCLFDILEPDTTGTHDAHNACFRRCTKFYHGGSPARRLVGLSSLEGDQIHDLETFAMRGTE